MEAFVQRQQREPPESDDRRLLSLGQDRRAWLLRPGLEILNRLTLAPFRNRLRVNAKFPAQRRKRSDRCIAALTACVAVALPGRT